MSLPARFVILIVIVLNRNIDRLMRGLIYALLAISGTGILVMIAVTCADVLLRLVRYPFVGAYDIVRIAGILTLGAGLPYTTAVKGHVAIEYFFHKLGRRSRIAVDTVAPYPGHRPVRLPRLAQCALRPVSLQQRPGLPDPGDPHLLDGLHREPVLRHCHPDHGLSHDPSGKELIKP